MTKTKLKTYKSNAFQSIHELANALYSIDAIDKKTMRRFDKSCLIPKKDALENLKIS